MSLESIKMDIADFWAVDRAGPVDNSRFPLDPRASTGQAVLHLIGIQVGNRFSVK